MKAAYIFSFMFLVTFSGCIPNESPEKIWPEIEAVNRPWTRWWWMGNAVDKANIQSLMKEYAQAGIGGVEITPIYGAKGYEADYLPFLSPQWMEMLDGTLEAADTNNMQVDINHGTGWPFGGPQITPEVAASKLIIQRYHIDEGKRLKEMITCTDQRQILAGATLQAVTAYCSDGSITDLTAQVDHDGNLDWTAKGGDWELYAAFNGRTLQKVKRAAPGGEGYTFDHFSEEALKVYLSRFDSAFGTGNHRVRCFFNDSYEVYGTNWTRNLFDEFEKRRGYPLQPYLRELAERQPGSETAKRVQHDYRETISDLLLDQFTRPWTDWAHSRGSITRNQAHGSPGNLLDLYAAVDIPECETFGSSYFSIPGLRRDSADIRNVDPDPVMLKFASSAANVSGKKLVSCETFTWLGEHFRVSLSQCKPEVEQAFLAGVNHVFFHGTTYSPESAGWPGWLFYASVNFAPSNSFWPHLRGLNNYITRCQSVLQAGVPDNELLIFWPLSDYWMDPADQGLQFTVHHIDRWLHPTPFYRQVQSLMKKGYSLDFVSERLLEQVSVKNGNILTKSGAQYKALVFPSAKFLHPSTLELAIQLARQGALVIFEALPEDVPGLGNLTDRREKMASLLSGLKLGTTENGTEVAKTGQGTVAVSENITKVLHHHGVFPEQVAETGLKFLRRKNKKETWYYLVNHSNKTIDHYIAFNNTSKSMVLLDPQSGLTGFAETKKQDGKLLTRISISPGEAMFLYCADKTIKTTHWKYLNEPVSTVEIKGPWNLEFIKGGPEMPEPMQLNELVPWTQLGNPKAANFSGSAVYLTFVNIQEPIHSEYLLNLGLVHESARVRVNSKCAGYCWSIPFTLRIGKFLHKGDNMIEIEVANLMANRIRWMDQQKIVWQNYHEINFVNIDYKPFDASGWAPMPSGLLGPVTISAYKNDE